MIEISAVADALPCHKNGQGYVLDCHICGQLARLQQNGAGICFSCDGGCEQEKIVDDLGSRYDDFARLLLNGLKIVEKQTAPERVPTNQEPPATSEATGGLIADIPQSNGNLPRKLDLNPSVPKQQQAIEPAFSRVPPQDIRAEQSLLGSILLEPESIDRISGRITPLDFYRESHREIYKAMLSLASIGKLAEHPEAPIDMTSLVNVLKDKGVYEAIGMETLMAITDATPTSLHIEHWADIVREKATRRDMIRGSVDLLERVYGGASLAELEEQWTHLKPLPVKVGNYEVIKLPDLTKKELEPLTWEAMRQRRATRTREWIVSGKLARGETSSWSGKVEAGKTTLMRELTLCVRRGEPFLGCETQQGRVAYLMLDADGEEATYDSFAEIGFTDEDGDGCLFLFETMVAQMDHGLEKLVKMLQDFEPSLVIVDPYPRLKMIEDFHSYTNTYLMALLSHVAKLINAHFALPGHIPRGRDDDADVATTGFGSISFSGGVNARFAVTNRNGTHTIRSSAGKGAGFEPFDGEQVLTRDEYTKRVSIDRVFSWKDKAQGYTEKLAEFLADHDDRPFDIVALAKEIKAQKSILRAAANMLFGQQKIRRVGDGLKTHPYIYASHSYHGEMTMEAVKG